MIGQCKFCSKNREMACCCSDNDLGCFWFEPRETLLESEIIEWMQFTKKQECITAEAILKSKRKYIKYDDNCQELR